MSNSRLISPNAAEDHICRTISLFMGRGRQHSVGDVEAATGIPERTLSAMIALSPENRRAPSGVNLLLLAQFFGTTFTDRLLGEIGQGARDLDPAPDAPSSVIATLMAGCAEFAQAGRDGQFCSRDRADLQDDAIELIQILTPFAAPNDKD